MVMEKVRAYLQDFTTSVAFSKDFCIVNIFVFCLCNVQR